MRGRLTVYWSPAFQRFIARGWPKGNGGDTPKRAAARASFTAATQLIKFATPEEVDSANRAATGTRFLPRDLLMKAACGTLFEFSDKSGVVYRGVRLVQSDIQSLLSSIGNTNGMMLINVNGEWVALVPGTSKQVLTIEPGTGNVIWDDPEGGTAADPTALAGPDAIAGVSTDYMRADAAPAIQLGSDTQPGLLQVDGVTVTEVGGVISAAPGVTAANPSATASDTAVNGASAHFMRADAAPAIQKASSAAFGVVKVDGTSITAAAGIISGVTAANPSATASDTAVNGASANFMRADAAPAIQLGSAAQYGIVKADGSTITASGGVLSASGVGGTTLISDTITSGAAASLTVSGISAGYKDLLIVVSGASAGSATEDALMMQLNGDTGTNYDWQRVSTSGTNNTTSNSSGAAAASAEIARLTGTTGTAHYAQCAEIVIPNYSSTVFFKAWKSHSGGAIAGTSANILSGLHGGVWKSTAAINAIKLFLNTGPFANGTRISVYGRA